MSASRVLIARAARPLAMGRPQRLAPVLARGMASKEDRLHQDADKTSAQIESHKQEQLRKQKEGTHHWEESLASSSESIVKADRGESGESTESILQRLKEESMKPDPPEKQG